jgi:hypothetical protein
MAHGHDTGPAEASADEIANASHADLEYLVNPPGAEYEHTDASVWTIAKFGLWLAVSAVVIHFGLGLMYQMLIRQATVQEQEVGQRYPLATATEPRLPPAPRLQQFPRNEMYALRLDQEQKLHSYGWVNKDAGTVHIPIDEAMKLVIQRGLVQARPEDPANPMQTPGLMPSDASSGRVMERRRQ